MAVRKTVEELFLELRVDLDKYAADLRDGQRKTKTAMDGIGRQFQQGFDKVNRVITRATAAFAVLAGAAGVGALVRRTAEMGAALDDNARKLGVSTEALQKYRFAAAAVGVQQNTLDMALQRFTRRAAEAASGTGEAQDALRELGIQLTDENGKLRDTETLFEEAIEALGAISNEGDRLRLSFKLFDSEGAQVGANLAGNLDTLKMRAEDLGIALDDLTIERARKVRDAFAEIDVHIETKSLQVLGWLIEKYEDIAFLWRLLGGTSVEEISAPQRPPRPRGGGGRVTAPPGVGARLRAPAQPPFLLPGGDPSGRVASQFFIDQESKLRQFEESVRDRNEIVLERMREFANTLEGGELARMESVISTFQENIAESAEKNAKKSANAWTTELTGAFAHMVVTGENFFDSLLERWKIQLVQAGLDQLIGAAFGESGLNVGSIVSTVFGSGSSANAVDAAVARSGSASGAMASGGMIVNVHNEVPGVEVQAQQSQALDGQIGLEMFVVQTVARHSRQGPLHNALKQNFAGMRSAGAQRGDF